MGEEKRRLQRQALADSSDEQGPQVRAKPYPAPDTLGSNLSGSALYGERQW